MRLAIVLVTSTLLAQPASIAVQEAERARQLMSSSRLVDKAWGVYLAGRWHAADLHPLLLEQFRSSAVLRNAPGFGEDYAFVATLFDAAIESGITVPKPLLEPFQEKWLDPVMILLARDNGSEEVLLSFAGGSDATGGVAGRQQHSVRKKVAALVCGDS